MSKKLTTAEFIKRSKELYEGLDYSKTVYVNQTTKVTLTCLKHNNTYLQRPREHYKFVGCPECNYADRMISFDTWYKRSKEANSKYDYDFENANPENFSIENYVNIVCRKHGEFQVKAKGFMYGRSNCLHCIKKYRKSTEDIVKECIDAHGNKFDYSFVVGEYSMREKIPIVCKYHGVFYQIAYDHIKSEYGCKSCADSVKGWKKQDWVNMAKDRPCTLYVIRCFNEDESFYKVGITSQTLNIRYKTKTSMPYSYEVLKTVEGDAESVWCREAEIVRSLFKFKYKPKIFFKGCVRECFVDIGELLNEI